MSSLRSSLSDSQGLHSQQQQQQPNGFIVKPEHISNGESHDVCKTDSNSLDSGGDDHGGKPSSYELAVLHEPLMKDDQFFNFGEAIIDQSKSLFEGSVATDFVAPSDQKFDPDLFDSILSSGDDILAQLDKDHGSRIGYEGVVSFGLDVRGGTGEEEEDRAESNTPTNASRPPQAGETFEDSVRMRALSTIAEDQGGELESPMMHPHPLGPHPLPSKAHPFPSMSFPFEQEEISDHGNGVAVKSDLDVVNVDREEQSPTPQRTSSLKSPLNQSHENLASEIEGGSWGGSEGGSGGGSEGAKHKEWKEKDESVVIRQLSRPHKSKKSSSAIQGPTTLISPPPEESESKLNTSIANPTSDSSSNLALDDNNFSASREDMSQNLSSTHSPDSHSDDMCLLESSMDSGTRHSYLRPVPNSNNDDIGIYRSHSSVEGSSAARCKTPQTPVHRPSSEFRVLQPLSPDHGLELNQQYEFLRRTLSHSQRRFSQRGRKPRERKEHGHRGGSEHSNHIEAHKVLGGSGLVQSQISPGPFRVGKNLSRDVRQKHAIGQLKSIMLESENHDPRQQDRDLEEHVDQHGRTYYMDHVTRTIEFDSSGNHDRPPEQLDIQSRREMLDRRYQNLQRSFRRTSRPNALSRNKSLFSNVRSRRTVGESGGSGMGQPGNENNSLSLSLAEAEAMARGMASQGIKKQRSKSYVGKWFTRKSSKAKTISQQGTSITADDIIPVSPTSSSIEGSPQPDNVSDSPSRSSESDSSSRNRNESGDSTMASLEVVGRSPSHGPYERNLTPASLQSAEFESGTDEELVTRQTSPPSNLEEVTEATQSHISESSADAESANGSGLRERQTSIVHASNLTRSDESAASRARGRASSKRRPRLTTDELTDDIGSEQEGEHVDISMSYNNIERRYSDSSNLSDAFITDSASSAPLETAPTSREEVEVNRSSLSGTSRGSMRKSKRSAKTLSTSPALRFIVRKDLYTFLNSAGSAGEAFFANRSLMELVQRIRSNNTLFEKYEHSHHLVEALNMFADLCADLPDGWEKKLNKQGRAFFIDHKYELTTFIDPRLPFPNTPYTYTDRDKETEGLPRQNSVPPALRPHHTTVGTPSVVVPDIARSEPTTIVGPSSPILLSPVSVNLMNSSFLEPTQGSANRLSVMSTASNVAVEPISYEEQVVAFFCQPTVTDLITQRYSRGIRPPLQSMIDAIRINGTMALERIQMSGSVATYELALVLSLFEEEISRMSSINAINLATAPSTSATPTFAEPVNMPATTNSNLSTLERRKEAFPTKLQNFKMMMARIGFVQGSRIRYNIRRDHMLEDAYEHIMKTSVKLLQKKRLNITFRGEEGLDYGGPSREFFFLLSREIFNPYYGLFEYSANDTYTIQISSTATFIQNSMEWFRFAGRVIALVIVQGFLLDVFFTRTVYKSLLCRPPCLKDLEALEPDFYNSLLWICDNDPEPLDLTFTVEEEAFGQLNTHELKSGGTDIPVTEDNKEEYVEMMLRWRLERGVSQPMEALKKGFMEVLPVHLLINFDAQELEFLMAGTLEIDLDDWKGNTEYRNGYHAFHPVVIWFWQMVESFDNEERLRLLQFVTGTSSVPIAGFKALRGSNGPKKFTIDYFNDIQAFPRSHTCFNRVDLPPYPSYDLLYSKFHFAITEGGGFGIE